MSAATVPAFEHTRPSGQGVRSLLRGRWRGLWRGPSRDPAWARPALFGLLAVTAVLYLFNLSRNGYANDFYAAAVQAGTRSWKAFFFGSFDASNFITVDKTPASLWVDELFARVFGFSSWTLLAPQALEGILCVAILYAAVRRWFGPAAGLTAGAVFALTPAAALMFRFNNPDALLTLLMTASAYCVQRAVERDARALRWLTFAGLLLGFAFLTKMMQAFLVLPGFAIAYLVAARTSVPRRIWHVLAGGLAVIAGAGWWVGIAQLWPAGSRPYFGGSTNNNILELALGYNGLGRLDGAETGSIGFNSSSVGGGGIGANFGGATGIFRLFQSEFGGQVSWLIPAALISLFALIWVARPRRGARPGARRGGDAASRIRAFAAVWGGWLIVTGLVFSYMQGIIHPYYMVALGPAIGALVGVGAISLWQARMGWAGRLTAVVAVLVTAWWSYELLGRSPNWLPWLRFAVAAAGVISAVALVAAGLLVTQWPGGLARAGGPRRALLDEEADGPAFSSAFSSAEDDAALDAAALDAPGLGADKGWVPVCGRESIPRRSPTRISGALSGEQAGGLPGGLSGGPKAAPAGFGGGAVDVRRRWDSADRARLAGAAAAVTTGAALVAGLGGPLAYTLYTVDTTYTGAIPSAGPAVTGAFGGPGGRFGGFPGRGGGFNGFPAGGTFPGGTFPGGGTGTGTGTGAGNGIGGTGNGTFPRFPRGNSAGGTGGAFPGGGGFGARGGGGFGGLGGGGLSGSTQVSSALIKLLERDSGTYRWIAVTVGTQEAAPIELATGGLPVVAIGGFNGSDPAPTLAQFESMVAKHEIHYYVGRGRNSFGGGSGSSSITSWVTAHYAAQTVGGTTVYDLTKPSS